MHRILLVLIMLCTVVPLHGQDIAKYQLTENRKVGTFTDMSGSIKLIGGNEISAVSSVSYIGFDFLFMGKVYKHFSVNVNGVFRLGNEAVLSEANTYGIPGNVRIVPFAGSSASLSTQASGKVHYKVSGSSPNRVLIVEWKDLYSPSHAIKNFTFQLRLHESMQNSEKSGRIEFIYGNMEFNNNNLFRFRTGLGIGPENGNFSAVNLNTGNITNEENYISEVSSNSNHFSPHKQCGGGGGCAEYHLLYRFDTSRKPEGTFSDFEQVCPAPNALTIRFSENCPDEAGIAVYRRLPDESEAQFKLMAALPPDSRSFSDGNTDLGARYVYRLYLLGEGQHAVSFTDYLTDPINGGSAFQAIGSGRWTNTAIWGGNSPATIDDVEIGCANSVFVTVDEDAQLRNLTIHRGSFLTIEDGVSLHVSGDFVNNGVFNPQGSGRLVLNGSDPQSITNYGKGITNDQLFTSGNNQSFWTDSQTGQVAEKTLQVNETDFSAIKSVKVNISHSFLRDLTLSLIAPDGTSFTLSRGRGQAGRDYSNVVFTETGRPLPPTIQNENLSGEYLPEESFANYSGTCYGTWRLRVRDDFTGNGGSLNTFDLTLSRGGTNDLVMRNITIDNTSAEGIILHSGIMVQSEMQLTRGVIHSGENASVLFEAAAYCNEGNAVSYIDGPVLKEGDTAFTFPLGNAGKWAPLTLENYRGGNAATVFKAGYLKAAAPAPKQLGVDLGRVSSIEYWDVHPLNGSATVDIVLHWKDPDESQILDIINDDLVVAHYTNGQWKSEGGVVLNGGAAGKEGFGAVAAGAVRAQAISTFSPFTFGSRYGVNPLPVKLLSFTANVEAQAVALTWGTATELNSSHFEIERSQDAADWATIGSVEGHGTTQAIKYYQYHDEKALRGRSFYRLKQVDYDGAFEYSPMAVVNKGKAGNVLKVYPNPAKGEVTIENNLYPAELILRSPGGVEVLRKQLSHGKTKFLLPELAEGFYLLEVHNQQGIECHRVMLLK